MKNKYKKLFEQEQNPKLEAFIQERIQGFQDIEDKLNELLPLLREAKQKTLSFYQKSPNFGILYSTELAKDYLDDLIKLFK